VADTVQFERRKRKRGRGYTPIANQLFDDDRLQADEQGLMGFLISRPPNWVVSRHQLGERYGFGREAMQRIIWNLSSTGWLGIVRSRHPEHGTVHTRLIINEEPGPEMTLEDVKALLRSIPPKGETWTSFGEDDGEDLDPPPADPPLTGQPLTGQPLTANPAGQVISTESLITESKIPPTPASGGCGGVFNPVREESEEPDRPAEPSPAKPPQAVFEELVGVWPPAHLGAGDRAEKRFRRLPAGERRAAIDGASGYLAGLRKLGRTKICDLATYLGDRRWKAVGGAAPDSAASGWDMPPRSEPITVKPDSTLATKLRKHWEEHGAPIPFMLVQLRAGKPITVTREMLEAAIGPATEAARLADKLRRMRSRTGARQLRRRWHETRLLRLKGQRDG
jgi:hypothetical protein